MKKFIFSVMEGLKTSGIRADNVKLLQVGQRWELKIKMEQRINVSILLIGSLPQVNSQQ